MIPRVQFCGNVVETVLNMLTSTLLAADSMDLHHIVLTGGSTGLSINNQLASVAKKVPERTWTNTHFWWGDERYVNSESPERNDIGIESGLGDFYIPANVHRVSTPDEMRAVNGIRTVTECAEDYARQLISYGSGNRPPRFAFVMLGVGPDGHIASLFPRSPQLDSSLVAMPVLDSPKPPPVRVTLGFATLNNSDCTLLLLSGESKRDALSAILNQHGTVKTTPARGIEATELYAVTDLLIPV